MFHRVKAYWNKFRMGEFSALIVFVGLAGVIWTFPGPDIANRWTFLISLEISHIERLLIADKQYLFEIQTPTR